MPGSAWARVTFAFPFGGAAVGGSVFPGKAPGGERSGRTVRGLLPRPAGEVLDVAASGA
jgi:hypothetical protein